MYTQNRLLKTIVFITVSSVVFGCDSKSKVSSKPTGFYVENDSLNIGTLNGTNQTKVVFKLSNTGDKAIQIKSTGSSCGCSKVFLTDSIIQPKTSQLLNVNFSPTEKGLFNKTIVVETNTEPSYKVLTFYGVVK